MERGRINSGRAAVKSSSLRSVSRTVRTWPNFDGYEANLLEVRNVIFRHFIAARESLSNIGTLDMMEVTRIETPRKIPLQCYEKEKRCEKTWISIKLKLYYN